MTKNSGVYAGSFCNQILRKILHSDSNGFGPNACFSRVKMVLGFCVASMFVPDRVKWSCPGVDKMSIIQVKSAEDNIIISMKSVYFQLIFDWLQKFVQLLKNHNSDSLRENIGSVIRTYWEFEIILVLDTLPSPSVFPEFSLDMMGVSKHFLWQIQSVKWTKIYHNEINGIVKFRRNVRANKM